MTAQYPLAGERMNFGVITWDDQHVYSNFISDWTRARSFGGKDIGFLKDFATHLSDLTGIERNNYQEFSPERIGDLINDWNDSIQFTAPRGSTHSLDIALVNGSPFAAVNAVSLGLASRAQLQKDIDQTAWIFDDVRMRASKLALAVYIIRAKDDDDLYSTTERTFKGLGSSVAPNDKALSRWTDAQVRHKLEAR
jgi:hypothetical protein